MPGIGYRVPALEKQAPGTVPVRATWWCLHCETVYRSVRACDCPHCSASVADQWEYYEARRSMQVQHWPVLAPSAGTVLGLYR